MLVASQPRGESMIKKIWFWIGWGVFFACGFSLSALQTLAQRLMAAGLINVQTLAPALRVELKYSTMDNFLAADVYGDLEQAFLLPVAAKKLALAEQLLRQRHPQYTLIVYDAVRPRAIQRRMWGLVKGTDKQSYVADPDQGSVHNYGAAIDLSILDQQGQPLDMGTPFDFFGDLAQPQLEAKYLAQGQLNKQQVANRQLLRDIMTKAGFTGIPNEWWHFNALPLDQLKKECKPIE